MRLIFMGGGRIQKVLIKLAIQLAADENLRNRVLILIASIIFGFMGMLFLPVVVLHVMSRMEPPEVTINESVFMEHMDTDRQTQLETDGQIIYNALSARGLRHQILKAQLIYLSCFEGTEVPDLWEYTGYFTIGDDHDLIASLNAAYGLDIDYEEFMRTYQFVRHVTIDPYLFTHPETKNAADLAAWCRNAYETEWQFQSGGHGEMDAELRRRTADNVGVILGYFNYVPDANAFATGIDTLLYTEQGGMDSMPDVSGIAVTCGGEFGIYGGNGQVFFASADRANVQCIPVTDVRWEKWVTIVGIEYPQEVWDHIAEMNAPEETEPEGE